MVLLTILPLTQMRRMKNAPFHRAKQKPAAPVPKSPALKYRERSTQQSGPTERGVSVTRIRDHLCSSSADFVW